MVCYVLRPIRSTIHIFIFSYVNVRYHDHNAQTLEDLKLLVIYAMETAYRFVRYPVTGVTLVFNMKGFGLANMDLGLAQFLIKALESYYPESLGRCLVIGAPFIFWGKVSYI